MSQFENPDQVIAMNEPENIDLPKEGYTPQFEAFKKGFEEAPDFETRLQLAVNFMESSLAQGGSPHFRSFWEARRLCLPLFRENINPTLRSHLWAKYSELSKEARRLKEILDEQSAFAVEQIEIAIQVLENEIAGDIVAQEMKGEQIIFPQALDKQQDMYLELQKRLNGLNVQASRINALRKELLKTEMRVRHKNKFFQRLSAAGDSVFPKRKELIKEISQQFIHDVEAFVKHHFEEEAVQESFFLLREEIKNFQNLAKVLTLNTNAFTQTRMRLSECWDRIKVEEKEWKKERFQQKAVFKENAEEIEKQIQDLRAKFESQEESPGEAQKKMEGIAAHMRKVELGRDEVKLLKDALNDLRKLIQEKLKAGEEARQQQEIERERQKKEKYQGFKNQIEQLIQIQEEMNADQLTEARDHLLSLIQNSNLIKSEKIELERLLKPLKDLIVEKQEQAFLVLSVDDRQALQQLKNVLDQRKDRRQEIKNHLDVLRKGAGSSNLDFEKAMNFTHQINEEKDRLDKANQSIIDIERKIRELQAKIR